jgi:hypothetical protein
LDLPGAGDNPKSNFSNDFYCGLFAIAKDDASFRNWWSSEQHAAFMKKHPNLSTLKTNIICNGVHEVVNFIVNSNNESIHSIREHIRFDLIAGGLRGIEHIKNSNIQSVPFLIRILFYQ